MYWASGDTGGYSSGGWAYSVPSLSFDTGSVYDDDGVDECDYYYNFVFFDPSGGRHALGLESPASGDCSTWSPPGGIIVSGGDDTLDAETQYYSSLVTVADADGTVYSFDTSGSPPQQVEDRNGNTATFAGNSETDSTGRTAYSISIQPPSPDTISISGISNPFQVNWGSVSRNYDAGVSLAYANNPNACAASGPTNTGTNGVVTSILLPNGKSYQFYYESTYGLLDEIVYPTGGWVKYTWGVNSLSEAVSIPDDTDIGSCVYRYGTPVVTKRQVSFDGANVAEEQDFTYGATNWIDSTYYTEWSSKSTTVTQTAAGAPNSQIAYTYSCDDFEPQPGGNYDYLCKPVENQIVYEDGNGTPLRTVNKIWESDVITSEQTILDDTGATSQISYKYSWLGDVPTPNVETNYDGSTRTTNITYAGLTGAAGSWVGDRPSSITLLDGSTEVAEADYSYDAYGNALTKTQKCLNGCPGGSGDATTTYTYDSYGQVTSKKYPNQNTTQYSYMCSDTYLSQITNPDNTTEKFSYDCPSGELLSLQDENGATTSYLYNDPLNRLTEIDYPDGGKTKYSYDDAAPSPSITTDKAIGNGVSDYVSTSTMDGLGHVIQTALSSDPEGTDYTATTYDGEGNLYQQSNPYRSTSDPTYGITTYNHDALGRLTSTVYPDNSSASVSYSGNCATATDAANRTNKTCIDAWGRLTSDTDGLGNTTTYGYDVLGNLTSVAQGVESRTFHYNSLSEMNQATNPESGTTSYTYDGNGNTLTRADARGATVQYAYDSMNRVQVQTNPSGTPSACFWYNNSSATPPSGCPAPPAGITTGGNLGGRMAYEWTSDGRTGTAFGYDTMGRITSENVCTPSTCGTSAYSQVFQYDLAGDQTSDSNGFGVTTDISYDAALRPSQVSSNFSDSNHPGTLWTANAYNAIGLTQATLGNEITENIGYDNRGRKTSDSFTNPVNSQNVYNYSLGYFPNGTIQSANDSANGNWTYTYDNLNRLFTASASTGPWASDTLQWGIDAWGNLNTQTLTAGSVPVPQPSLSSNSNNQIAGYCYDQAGNLVDEGDCRLSGSQEYTYDGVGRLTSPDYGNTTYVYDASGQRVAKQSNGISNYEYLYDLNGNQITEIAAQTSYLWNRGEVYAGNRHIATYIGGTTYFAHTDWLGNERVHSKMDATVQDSCANLPFGDDLTCPISGVNPYHFTGKQRDEESGDDYFGARYYTSTMGRFLSPDPAGVKAVNLEDPQTWDLYTYSQDSPLTVVDPTGLDPCIPAGQGGFCLDADPPSGVSLYSEFMENLGEECIAFAGGCVASDPGGAQKLPSNVETTVIVNAEDGCDMSNELCQAEYRNMLRAANAPPMIPAKGKGQAPNSKPQSLLQKWAKISVLSPNHCLGTAARTTLSDMAWGEGAATAAGGVVGGLVAGGVTAASDAYPLEGATVPAGIVGGSMVGAADALPVVTFGSIAHGIFDYLTCR